MERPTVRDLPPDLKHANFGNDPLICRPTILFELASRLEGGWIPDSMTLAEHIIIPEIYIQNIHTSRL